MFVPKGNKQGFAVCAGNQLLLQYFSYKTIRGSLSLFQLLEPAVTGFLSNKVD